VAAAGLSLALGLLVYMADRPPSHAVLMPAFLSLGTGALFGAVGLWLPSFVHPFAFSLFTAAALPSRSAWRYRACACWCAVNLAFEMGQHPQVSARLAEAMQGSFGPTLLTRPFANFFLRGAFDSGDIVATLLGALAAAGMLRLMERIPENDHAS
jgi:hypothetical protein